MEWFLTFYQNILYKYSVNRINCLEACLQSQRCVWLAAWWTRDSPSPHLGIPPIWSIPSNHPQSIIQSAKDVCCWQVLHPIKINISSKHKKSFIHSLFFSINNVTLYHPITKDVFSLKFGKLYIHREFKIFTDPADDLQPDQSIIQSKNNLSSNQLNL